MREKFDNRLLKGKIEITCKKKDPDDPKKKICAAVWTARKEDIIDAVLKVINSQSGQGYNISLRGLFYKLVALTLMPNYLESYKKLGEIIRDCRYAGILDWDSIKVDGARVMDIDYAAEDIPDFLSDVLASYKLDRQRGQYNYIEVWCEKDTLIDILNRSTKKYHIPRCIVKGNNSSSAIYRGYQRFREQIHLGRQVKLLYIGDHDPSGIDMRRDIEERVRYMLNNSTLDYSQYNWNLFSGLGYKSKLPEAFEFIPIALNLDQVRRFNLPANYAKESNSLTPWYENEFGTRECWEVDALDSKELSDILNETITGLLDIDLYNEVMDQEVRDRKTLKEYITKL